MRRLSIPICILIAFAGCKKEEPTKTPPVEKGKATQNNGAATTGTQRAKNILVDSAVVPLLPKTTEMALAVEGMAHLSRRLGLPDIAKQSPSAYEILTASTREIGLNIFDPGALKSAGFDPTAPMGAAVMSVEEGTGLFWGGISDEKVAEATVKGILAKMGAGDATRESTDNAVLIHFKNEKSIVFVLRDKTILVVVSDTREALPVARELIERKPEDSLSQDVRFTTAMSGLKHGQSFGLYGDPGSITRLTVGLAATDMLFGTNARLAVGGDDTGPAGELALAWRATDVPLLAPLVAPKTLPAVFKVVTRQPLALVSLTLEPAKLKSTLSSLGALADLKGGFQEAFDINLEADLLGLVTGHLSWAFTADRPLAATDMDEDYLGQHTQGHVLIGVKDEAKAKTLLDTLAKALSWVKDGERYRLKLSDWKDVTVGVAAGHVVATSDPSVFDRLSGKADVPATVTNPRLKALLASSGKSVVGLLDLRAIAGVLLMNDTSEGPERTESPEAAKLTQRIKAEEKALNQALSQGILDAFGAVGTLALTVAPVDGGADLTFGAYYGKASLAEVAGTVAEVAHKRRTVWRKQGIKLDELRGQREKLGGYPMREAKVAVAAGQVEAVKLRRLRGRLTYTPLPATKSVRAYLGVEFELIHGTEKVALKAGQVTRDQLIAAKDKQVTIECIPGKATAPNPMEPAPMGPDGQPMARPARCKVETLKVQ